MPGYAQMDEAWGYARVNGGTVAPADGSDVANGGFRTGCFLSCQRTGPGAYTLTLDPDCLLDTLQSYCDVSLDQAPAVTDDIHAQHSADNTVLVTAFAAGVATDKNFKIMLRKVRPTIT